MPKKSFSWVILELVGQEWCTPPPPPGVGTVAPWGGVWTRGGGTTCVTGGGGATPRVLGRQLPPPQGASGRQLVVKGISPMGLCSHLAHLWSFF